jgi:plasmid stabilization system protein ParE
MIDVRDDRDVAQIHFDFPGNFEPARSSIRLMLQRSIGNATAREALFGTGVMRRRQNMPKGAYTAKQERKADHIEKSYEERGVGKKEAEERAWRTVNKQDKGGKNTGHGRSSSRSAAAKKGWETRRKRGKG